MSRLEALIAECETKRELANKIIDNFRIIICDSDPSPKAILSEPYRSILEAVEDYFFESVEESKNNVESENKTVLE